MHAQPLTEDDWACLAQLRLAAVHAEPEVFGWALPREGGFTERHWRLRLRGASWWAAVTAPDVGPDAVVGPDAAVGRVDGAGAAPGAAVGLLSLMREPGAPETELHLMALWVAPEHRRRGAARALVQAAAVAAGAAGADRVTTWAHEAPDVDGLLRACGFRQTGERVAAPRDPSRAEVRWERQLGGEPRGLVQPRSPQED